MTGANTPSKEAILDISMALSEAIAVFPGDTPLSREVLLDTAKGDHITLSTLRSTVHVGTHLDAPTHYGGQTETIDRVPLSRTIGECVVLRCAGPFTDRRVRVANLADSLEALGLAGDMPLPERVLIATDTFPDPNTWTNDFAGLDPALVDHLADRGVRLVGVDTPSVDCADSKDLPAHARCLARDVLILEGLRLAQVESGRYELLCLPLRLVGFDASPVRAALRRLPSR
jgi:arylformamidase